MSEPRETMSGTSPMINRRRPISRRTFLRGAGVALSLPMLDAMTPALVRAAPASTAISPTATPRRMLAVCNNLGVLQKQFFPSNSGKDYTPSPYLELLQEHRNDFTSLEGVWNPDCDGGHPADICFLTAAPHPGRGNFRNTISLDQLIAERIGHLTRHPYLSLGINVEQGLRSVCWTSNGVLIPPEEKITAVFRRLFVQGSDSETQAQMRRLELGESILDAVANQAKRLQQRLGARDRNRLDQYFTSVRDLEQKMNMSKAWESKPKPVVNVEEPVEPSSRREFFEKLTLQYDLARLAFETDQTRVITIFMDSVNSPAMNLEGTRITDGYHNLSHHGRSKAKLEQLTAIDKQHMILLSKLFTDLKSVSEDGETLLDRTMVLFGSNLGDADAHVNTNVPTLFAGGGFKHGQHLAFDTQFNYPLPNLFVSMLQRMGIEMDRFATSTGTMRGLEPI
jgi:Protein of unknown function (DUF1552)